MSRLALPFPPRGNIGIKQERSRDMLTCLRAIGHAALALTAVGLFGSPIRAQERLQSPTLDPEWVSAFHWRSIGPAAAGGRILRIAVVENDPKVWYVSTASGGLWKTTNNGVTFGPLFQHENTISIGDIAVSQSNPDILWVGTGENNPRNSTSWGDGVYKSTDGGQSWTNVGLRGTFQVGRIAVHPDDPDVVYVGALGRLWGPNEERGVFKTTDGGRTWSKVLYISEDTGFIELQMNPGDPDQLLAAAYQRRRDAFEGGEPAISSGPESGVYKTVDGGQTWYEVTDGLPSGDMGRTGITYHRNNPDIVYLQTGGSRIEDDSNGIYRSDDAGESWHKVSDVAVRPMYYSQIRVDPSDDQRIYTLATRSHRSSDGGVTMTQDLATGVHEDSHELWIDPEDGAHMILGNDGGLFRSYDYGDNWDFLGSLPVAQSYSVCLSPERLYWVYTGLQDNGNWGAPSAKRGNRGAGNTDWLMISGADGFVCAVDPTDPTTLYYETQGTNLRRMDLATGATVSIRPQAEDEVWSWEGPVHLSPHDSRIFFTAGKKVYRSYDRGENPWPISLDMSINEQGSGSAVAQSPMNPEVIYAGYTDGALWVTRDGGAMWSRIDENVGLPGPRFVDSIEPSRFAEGRVYVAFDGHRSDDDAPHAYVSEDFGVTWRSLNETLPAIGSTRALREDIYEENLLYGGTEFGVFASVDRGYSWTRINGNVPTNSVQEVAIHPVAGEIAIATHGRGIWILDVTHLRQMTEARSEEPYLFDPAPGVLWGPRRIRRGDLYGHDRFYAENHPDGVVIYYSLPDTAEEVTLTVHDTEGTVLRTLSGSDLGDQATSDGLHRVIWDLRRDFTEDEVAARESGREGGAGRGRGGGGRGGRGRGQTPQRPRVEPGVFQLTVTIDGEELNRTLQVVPDPGNR